MVYVLRFKQNNPTNATLKQIEESLITQFKSVDFMEGYLLGYMFGCSYKVFTLKDFENRYNNTTDQSDYYIKFLTVLEIEE